jgi:transposase
MTGKTVKLFHHGRRVASHVRSALRNRNTTIAEHMPSSHRWYAEWTPARIAGKAEGIGPATVMLCAATMRSKPHPEAPAPASVSCA